MLEIFNNKNMKNQSYFKFLILLVYEAQVSGGLWIGVKKTHAHTSTCANTQEHDYINYAF